MKHEVDTLERLTPDEVQTGTTTGDETLRLHLERYEFAATHDLTGRLLDIACGVGYGTRLLSDRCAALNEVLGVDLSLDAIKYAQQRYSNARTKYITHDAITFMDSEGFDVIVSLETIEHLPDPKAFVDNIISLLRPGGILIASVPITPSVDANPHHLTDFTEKSFRRLFHHHRLVELDSLLQVQPFKLRAAVLRNEERMQDMRSNLSGYYIRHPGGLLRRLWSTFRYGFNNHYLTVVWQASVY